MPSGSRPGAIQRFRSDLASTGPRRAFEPVTGSPFEYEPAPYLREEGWPLLPQAEREWTTTRAGAPITCPVTRAHQQYWFSNIEPRAVGATYELFTFGKAGLAVCEGETSSFTPSPAANRWRTRRWWLPIEQSAVRSAHITTTSAEDRQLQHGPEAGTGRSGFDLLGEEAVADFGNLPAPTQTFLVEPFVASGRRPQQVAVRGVVEPHADGSSTERLWVYLFNARAVSFAYLQRRWPVTSQPLPAPHPGDGAAAGLGPWQVAAWTAPAAPERSSIQPPTTKAIEQ